MSDETNKNEPPTERITEIKTKEDLMRFHREFTRNYMPMSKPKIVLGLIAWLIIYGIGSVLFVYILISVILEKSWQ
ncbi:hypothetical protein [Thiosulfativibrio zosterae]|uniref:Uncharacterized protein n=1 Tax=Thiosulfativibrio zosterae TaxID=2675053 RepID=A0A6F8PR09_9GAMM|nr:hypothetical protein [Thiosulfativibrio zosterae]BBP44516.1 hypothetical protein THMIRHAT_22620 [Thiosulfativibrio zosterae]